MKITQSFIERPILAAVLSILLVLAGLIALPLLPISEYPQVVPPTVVVTANYPGADHATHVGNRVAAIRRTSWR